MLCPVREQTVRNWLPKRFGGHMLGCGQSKTFKALGLTILMFGCDNVGRTATVPSVTPTPIPIPTPIPSPAPRAGDNILSGVVFEITPTGRNALEGITVYLLTCGAPNCPRAVTAAHEVTTGKDGGYHIAEVYSGDLNYLWVRNNLYDLVEPMAPGTCPDGCDRVLMINGDTRLDIDLVRR